jgi:hypothetical protein
MSKTCPFAKGDESNLGTTVEECDENGCAWWDELSKKCAVLLIAQKLNPVGVETGLRRIELNDD